MARSTWWLIALGAAAAGAVWGLCFTRTSHAWLGWFALAPLFLLLGLPRPGWLGFWHGMGFWVSSLWWIRATMKTYGQLDPVTATLAILAVGVFQGSYSGLFGWLGARLWKSPHAGAALVGLPSLWVAIEWLKGYGPPGFPWNLAGYAWVDMPGALPLASWIGAWGISLLVGLVNCGLALGIARRRAWPAVSGTLVAALLLAAGGRWGRGPAVPAPAAGEALEVRLLQPDLPILVEWDAAKVKSNYETLLAMSRAACDAPGAILFWPESATWPYSLQRDPQLRADVAALVAAGCPVVVNSDFDTGDGIRNGAALIDAAGWESSPRYDKRHLVPFGEYVPLRRWIPFLDKLARNAGEFATGDRVVLLPAGRERLGMSICYEIVFPGEVAEQVAAGATVLATVTNDGWYGNTSAPWQHFRAARFRAAENRRPLLRAALTGVSGVLGADGRVLAQLAPGEHGVLRASVAGRRDRSPYSRAPWLVPLAAALAAAAAFAFVIIRR